MSLDRRPRPECIPWLTRPENIPWLTRWCPGSVSQPGVVPMLQVLSAVCFADSIAFDASWCRRALGVQARDFTGAVTLLEFNRRSEEDKLEETLLWLGYCAFHLGNYERAIDAYKVSTSWFPTRACGRSYWACRTPSSHRVPPRANALLGHLTTRDPRWCLQV